MARLIIHLSTPELNTLHPMAGQEYRMGLVNEVAEDPGKLNVFPATAKSGEQSC